MQKINLSIFFVLLIISTSCESKKIGKKEKIKIGFEKKVTKKKNKKILLDEPNIILMIRMNDFFYKFNKQNKYNKVKISTSFGVIIIRL